MLSRYRVTGQIGTGGMGEVYKAVDTSLDRSVALKILRADLVHDSERLRRFSQEAKAASALNHPHVVHIYEIGESDSTHFIAMEYVDGTTLRAKIHDEQAPFRALLPLLIQVAEALAKAHAAGIVHRDLKPDNIMVSSDGYAKIVDFGLAKLIDGAPFPADATIDKRDATADGVILGTVGYMAPEQIDGRAVDHRADIFSFGCILYEAIARRRPFGGRNAVDTLHKILNDDPPPLADADTELQRIVRRCLRRNPDERYQSIKEVALELGEFRSISEARPALRPARRFAAWWWLVPALAAVAILAVLLARSRRVPATVEMTKITASGKVSSVAIAPNGTYAAYVENDRAHDRSSIWIYHLATGSRTEAVSRAPYYAYHEVAFSADSNRILYVVREHAGTHALMSVPLLGGTPARIAGDVDTVAGASPDGQRLAFIRSRATQTLLVTSSADGGNETALLVAKQPERIEAVRPTWTPDGRAVTCAMRVNGGAAVRLANIDTADREVKWIGPEWSTIAAIAAGPSALFIAATQAGQQSAIWRIEGANVRKVSSGADAYTDVSVTNDGRSAVALSILQQANLWSVPLTEPTRASAVTSGSAANGADGVVTLPDGRVLYVSVGGGASGLRLLNRDGSDSAVAVHGTAKIGFPSSSPDGRWIAADWWQAARGRLARIDLDTGNVKELTAPGMYVFQPQVSPDGRWIVYNVYGPPTTLMRIPSAGGQPQEMFPGLHTQIAAYSPDGNWIASFAKIGENAMYAVFPSGGGAAIATFRPDTFKYPLRWTRDSKSILYIAWDNGAQNIFAQPIAGGPPHAITSFTADDQIIWSFDTMPDNRSIICSRGNYERDAVLIHNLE